MQREKKNFSLSAHGDLRSLCDAESFQREFWLLWQFRKSFWHGWWWTGSKCSWLVALQILRPREKASELQKRIWFSWHCAYYADKFWNFLLFKSRQLPNFHRNYHKIATQTTADQNYHNSLVSISKIMIMMFIIYIIMVKIYMDFRLDLNNIQNFVLGNLKALKLSHQRSGCIHNSL